MVPPFEKSEFDARLAKVRAAIRPMPWPAPVIIANYSWRWCC